MYGSKMILITHDLDLVTLRDLPIGRIFYCRRQKSKSDVLFKVIPKPKELNSNGSKTSGGLNEHRVL